MPETPAKARSGKRSRRRAVPRHVTDLSFTARGVETGALRTLDRAQCERIHQGALEILKTVGFGQAPDFTRERLLSVGCFENRVGRLCFPPALVEDALARTNRSMVLYGQESRHDVELTDGRTYFSTGCGSVRVVDPQTKAVRDMLAVDVYNFARIVDVLDNIHIFHRCGTPTDLSDPHDVDVNLCYACVKGTAKHVSSSWFDGDNLPPTLEMLHTIAGSEANWRARPFVTNTCTFVVPPLNFSPEACLGLEHSIRGGMPVQLTSAGQMGATAPVTVAGTLVQTMAEILGGLVYALALDPEAKLLLGTWPMVSDLRTGAATTGSAEQALVSSASCQMARFYGIPNGTISGISDSKLPDAQAGFEKGIQHAYVGNSGGNILFCSAGSLGTGLGCSHAGMVIDDEIIGVALRTMAGFEVDEETLGVDVIASVCNDGPGHFLGHDHTLQRMKNGFFYPDVSDRNSIKDWLDNDATTILDNATATAQRIMREHKPTHISDAVDEQIRNHLNIALPITAVRGAGAVQTPSSHS